MKVEYIKTSEISLFKENINSVVGRRMSDLIESIKTVGIKEPLVVVKTVDDKGYVVLDGNHRLSIAEMLRIPEVPCIVKDIKPDAWLNEHVQLNYFRGEIQLQKITNLITTRLDEGEPIEKLAELLGMRKHWVLAHYEMGKQKTDFTDRYFAKKSDGDRLLTMPVTITSSVLYKILRSIHRRDAPLIRKSLQCSINRYTATIKSLEKRLTKTNPIAKDGVPNWRYEILVKELRAAERKLADFIKLHKDVSEYNATSQELQEFVTRSLNMAELSEFMGILLEDLTDELLDKYLGAVE